MNKRKLANNGTNSTSVSKKANIPVEEPVKENAIRYYLAPSLEHLSAVKVIITLWSQKNIQDEIIKLFTKRSINCRVCKRFKEYSNLKELWHDIKNKIFRMVLELSEFDAILKILSDLVKPIGQEIFDWIEYQDENVFYIRHCIYQNVAVNYLDCLVWTSRGIIDYEETAKTLLAKGRLCDVENYHLACSYCFEDDIAIIMPNLLDIMRCFTSLNFYDQKTMVYFWSARLTRDFTRLNEEVRYYNTKFKTDYSINECIFRILACKHRNNQVAIKFMWNMLSDDEKSRQILSVIKYSKTDLKCFFLSQMSEAQQQLAFRAESKNMLLCLLDDWLWKDYFLPTMHYIWNIIPALDFLLVVEDIVLCRMEQHYEYYRYKAILKELWRSAPKSLKAFIFEFENGSRSWSIFFSLLCERNIDMILSMLLDMNDVQKKTMVFSSSSNFHKCYWLIINDQIDVVKLFIDNTLITERDVDMFKRMLVESYGCNYGRDIVAHFERNQRRDKAEEFMEWVFKSDNDKREFIANLAHSEITDDILDSIVADGNEKIFAKLEHFFQWCASGNTQKVSQLKREMYEVYFSKVISKFIEEDKYQLLEQFFSWCFSGNEVELVKHTFHEYHNYILLVQLVLKLVEKNNKLQSLEKFVLWCFAKKRNIARFKKWILEYSSENTVGVCIELLCKDRFNLADEFVHWCCNSSQMKISKFKGELLFCDNIKYLFPKYEHDRKYSILIKWFDSSAKVIIQFRKKFVDFHWLTDNDIAVHLMKNQKWEEAEQYIQLTFNSDSDKTKFKENLAYSEICDNHLEYIVSNNNVDWFVQLENFFLWCASGKADVVVELKVEMYQRYFTKVICRLIKKDKYQLLEQFLKWCYRNEKPRVELLKLYFCGYYKYSETVQLVLYLVERNDQLRSLEKFVHWCFTEHGEIARFKNFILEPGSGHRVGVCIQLLCGSKFELADEFVCWCCASSQRKVGMFKNKLMLYEGIKYLFNLFKYDEKTLKKLIKWFNPSSEVKILFRKMFEDLWWVWIYLPVTDYNDMLMSV